MTTNKERIENLEVGLGGLQDSMGRLELGFADKFHQMEDTLNKLTEVLLSNKEGSNNNTNDRNGDANQWWQWLRRAYKEEGREVTWEIFEEELWARFRPTECEDFDEALSRVKHVGSLWDYQKEFERLGNRMQGWTQKALAGTFMGGLKPELVDDIRMFKSKLLKEAISLARMRDEQLIR
ncbi:hypothetical protein F0562_029498 [Nyssa sinensis]|uniref:Retrotransposon gag domain-containing protein n=1 Tax=Nyssa sinensis TaxID=561372 RepID=A0A5J5B382_9ASTE|nr:hypothetical protein F0562_029498 [Nyssa sinensis]